jgi:predicted nucleotidyltransferase component of viral defense system
MYSYKTWDKVELQEAFVATAQEMNVTESIIEKDFWVCFTLKLLFSIDEVKDHLTFKGGTSLSKIYKIISRFSEDIDVSIERKFFGFEGEKEPLNATSNKKSKILVDELSQKCSEYVKDQLLEMLKKEIIPYLNNGDTWKLEIDPEDKDQQTILFYYPTLFETKASYVKKHVKIEIGARSDHWPVSMKHLYSYAEEKFPALKEKRETLIRVLNAERTFWEKATILHKYSHFPKDKIVPIRQSRHYYDFYCLLNSEVKEIALNNIDLLEKVVLHKSLYFKSAWANYATAKKGTLKIIPDKTILDSMGKDYQAMAEMFFQSPPNWDEIVRSLTIFEKEFNN